MANDAIEEMFARARALKAEGTDPSIAFNIAALEMKIRQWPPEWGDDLRVLFYGDFQVPKSDLSYPSLGITVGSEKKKKTILRTALTVVEATVKIKEKSIAGLIDAGRRINLLLGAYVLHGWGNGGIRWWSYVTHGGVAGVSPRIDFEGIDGSISAVLNLSPEVSRKIDAALFWIREPRNLILESHREDTLRVYSAYWNAFECLVEAVNICQPRVGLTKSEKQRAIDELLAREGKLGAGDVQDLYVRVINPGFVGKAIHALKTCFGKEDATQYADECFLGEDKTDTLYGIRNAINHGEIDAENPYELYRVEARMGRLWMITWRMFRQFVPFRAPRDPDLVRRE